MTSLGKKQIAMFLIMLLAVHEVAEAFRIHKQRRPRAAGFVSQFPSSESTSPLRLDCRLRGYVDGWLTENGQCIQGVEAAWQTENRKCGSKPPFLWCSKGPSHPNQPWIHRCARQPLLGDIPGSNQVCRVTDEWMLAGTPDKPASEWLSMQIGLLNAKTSKLLKSCQKGSSTYSTWRCKRRMQHVLRAIKFIGKASQPSTSHELTREEITKARDAADDASKKIASILFVSPRKQELVNRIVRALKNDQRSLQTAPKARITRALKVLQDILPDDANLAAAEVKIQKMELEARPAVPGDQQDLRARMKELQGNAKGENAPIKLGNSIDDTFEEIEWEMVEAEPEEAQRNLTESSSLVQRRGRGLPVAVKAGFVVVAAFIVFLAILVVAPVLWGLLVLWVVGNVFVCSWDAYQLEGNFERANSMGLGMKQSRARYWANCALEEISSPFILAWGGIKRLKSRLVK